MPGGRVRLGKQREAGLERRAGGPRGNYAGDDMESRCGVLSRFVWPPLWTGSTLVSPTGGRQLRGYAAKRLCRAGERGRLEAAEIRGGAKRIFRLTAWGCGRKIRGDPKFLA